MEIEEIKIGTDVIYWGFIDEDGRRSDPLKTIISSEAWEIGHGDIVCKILGKSGGVLIKHLDPITTGSLMAAKFSGLKSITNEDIDESTRKFFEEKGVSIKIN